MFYENFLLLFFVTRTTHIYNANVFFVSSQTGNFPIAQNDVWTICMNFSSKKQFAWTKEKAPATWVFFRLLFFFTADEQIGRDRYVSFILDKHNMWQDAGDRSPIIIQQEVVLERVTCFDKHNYVLPFGSSRQPNSFCSSQTIKMWISLHQCNQNVLFLSSKKKTVRESVVVD